MLAIPGTRSNSGGTKPSLGNIAVELANDGKRGVVLETAKIVGRSAPAL